MAIDQNQIWREAVTALMLRNGAVELSPPAPPEDGGPTRVDRCRLLSVEETGELVIERPAPPGAAALFAPGMETIVTVAHRGQRWEGRCRVIRGGSFRLNAESVIAAIRLTPPDRIESGQRRQFFRVPIGARDASLELYAVLFPNDAAVDANLEFLEPAILNLSGGGVGVSLTLSPQVNQLLQTNRPYRCVLRLSGHPEPLELPSRLIHIEPLAHQRVYLGLEFIFDDPAIQRHVQDLLTRAATEIERRQLRRQRGA